MKTSNINILLEESHLKYYLTGLILADGHISNNRLRLRLSIKDKNYLLNLANILNIKPTYEKNNTVVGISIMNTNIISKYIALFDIHSNKTLNPPNLNHYRDINKEYLLSLFIGFIDGDGSIQFQSKRKDIKILIKNYHTWINFLEFISLTLCNKNLAKINKAGYSLLTLSNSEICKLLKNHAIKYKLPIMLRKWDKINLNYVSRYITSKKSRESCINLYLKNFKQKEIAETLNISISWVSIILKQWKQAKI
jgi:hypothetical protein